MDNILHQLIYGAEQVKRVGLNLLCRFLTYMASSVKRQSLIQQLKDMFFFENTRSSKK